VEQAIDSFIRFLAVERGLSENYQLSTQRSLSEFAQWCAAKKEIESPRGVTLPVISEYLADRKRAGLAASSIKLIVVAIKIFFRFLAGRGAVERDPSEALALPRIERYLPETLNELQVEQLLEKIDTKTPHGLRDRAMIELLYASGLRVSELANARLENFNFEERVVRVTGQRKQDADRAGGTQSMRSARRLSLQRTPQICEAPHQQRDFSFGARHEINNRAHLADCKKACAPRRIREKYLSPSSPAQFRDASPWQRRRPAHYPGNARPRGYFDDASLHACRSTAAQSRAPTISSTRVILISVEAAVSAPAI
jgi:site-specific recombinase XerD